MNNNKLEILVTAKDAASNVIQGVGKSFGNLSDNAMRGSKIMAAGVAVAGAATVAFGKQSVDAYFGAAEASAKLATNLMNVKGNTAANVKELEGLASKLQSIGVIEDDVIKAGMSQLATFNLQGATIAKLTPKITDMVAQMKGHNATAEDMVGINNLVGKVMTGNVGALSRYGVTLSDNQEALLKQGTEAERAAILNEVLAQNFGKVNESLRKTPQGMWTGIKNDLGDLQEGVGQLIVAGFMPLMSTFSNWMAKVNEAGGFVDYFSALIRNNMDTVKMLAGALIAVLIPAIVSMVTAAGPVILAIAGMAAAGALLAPHIDNLVQKFGGWEHVLNNAKEAAKGVFETIKLLITGDFKGGIFGMAEDSTFIDWLFRIREGFIQVVEFVKSTAITVFNGLKMAFEFLLPSLSALWNTISTNLIPTLVRLWQFIEPVIIPTLKVLGAIIGGVLVAAIWIGINAINAIIQVVTWFINVLIEIVQRVVWVASMIMQYLQLLYTFWSTIFNAIFNVVKFIFQLIATVIATYISIIMAIVQPIAEALSGPFRRAVDWVKGAWGSITGFFSGIVGGIRGAVSGVADAIIGPFNRAVDLVRGIPGKIVSALGNVGNLVRNTLGDFDIPGPLGKVRDVIPGFASGGFTGRGPADQVAGVVHAGEYVVPKRYVNQSTGLPMMGGGGGMHIEIHGNVVNETAAAAKAWWDEMNRMGELAEQGAAI